MSLRSKSVEFKLIKRKTVLGGRAMVSRNPSGKVAQPSPRSEKLPAAHEEADCGSVQRSRGRTLPWLKGHPGCQPARKEAFRASGMQR